jgi:hypothetical protein
VWSLGLIAFFLLTAKPFWRTANDPEGGMQPLMREVLFDRIPTATERARQLAISGSLPAGFDEWFARCVVRDPAARFSDAREAFAAFAKMCERTSDPSLSVLVRPAGSSTGKSPEIATAPTQAQSFPRSPTEAKPRRAVRPLFVVAGLLTLAGAGAFAWDEQQAPDGKSPPRMPVVVRQRALPNDIVETPGGRWFARVRGRCNAREVDAMLRGDPPPGGKDGVGFAAACVTFAGRTGRAHDRIAALPHDDRAFAAYVLFEVVRASAEQHEDKEAAETMSTVAFFWPDNYIALYLAGVSEYRSGELEAARLHLEDFQRHYAKNDAYSATAAKVLARIDAPGDCKVPVAVDPEGHKINPVGCR